MDRSGFHSGLFLGLLALVLSGLACPHANADSASDKLVVWVSIAPQRFFVERIAGERADVHVMVGTGLSPATYEPTPKQMASLEKADLYLRIGVPFEESLIAKILVLMPDLTMVDGRRGIELEPMSRNTSLPGFRSGHGKEHDHHSGRLDPHFWLDPLLVKIHAEAICQALCTADPGQGPHFRRNLRAFQQELDAVHALVAKRLSDFRGKDLLVFHPAYGYLARRYGLNQIVVESEGKRPSARQLAVLIDGAKKAGIRSVFVQPQFSDSTAQALAEAIGARVVALDPLAEDYLTNLGAMADRIAAGFEE
jgi:zinc transport system substrate-binding protein